MNVGDITVTLRADGTTLQADAVKAANTAGSSAATGFGANFKNAITKLNLGGVVKTAFSVAGGLALFSGIEGGIRGVVNAIGDLVKAGADGEAADARLTASLKANTPDWQAHTDAIEAAAAAGVKLGFADDDIKNSLALLVVHTHDAAKAIDVQRVAMDLARLKGISLAAASTALGKAYDGNTTALQRMGIHLDKGVKGFDAIAAVEKVAGGQAQAFSDTGAGAAASLSASLQALQEKIGRDLLPAFKGLVAFIAGPVLGAVTGLLNGIGNLGTAFDNLHRAIDPNYKAMQDTDTAVRQISDALGLNTDQIVQNIAQQKLATAAQLDAVKAGHEQDLMNTLIDNQNKNLTSNLGELATAYSVYGIGIDDVNRINAEVIAGNTKVAATTDANTAANQEAIRELIPYVGQMALARTQTLLNAQAGGQAREALAKLAKAYHDRRADMAQDSNGIAKAFHHVQSAAHNMQTNVVSSFDLMQGGVLGALKQTVADAGTQLTALWYEIKHPGELKTNRNALANQMADAQAALLAAEKTGDANVIADARALVATLQAEWDKLNATITLNARVDYYNQNRHPLLEGGAASGGPRPAGWTGLVGEEGAEMLTLLPGGGGYVTSHADLMSNLRRAASPSFPSFDSGGSRLDVHHTFGPIRVDGNISPEAGREVGRGIGDRLSGVLVELRRQRGQPVGAG